MDSGQLVARVTRITTLEFRFYAALILSERLRPRPVLSMPPPPSDRTHSNVPVWLRRS